MSMAYQPKTGAPCSCRRGNARDNCPQCEGTGWRIDFGAIRARTQATPAPDKAKADAHTFAKTAK